MAKKKKKKQITYKDLKSARVSSKSLSDYKKTKDKIFRKKANESLLLPSINLNAELRLKAKELKGSKSQINSQKNKIRALQKENNKINAKRRQLKKEYAFSSDKRKRQIDQMLDSPDLRLKDISLEKNYLNAISGKNFDYIVNDSFKKYKIKLSELKKVWKRGGDATILILKKLEQGNKQAIKHFKSLLKKEKNTASKQRIKKLNRIINGLEKKFSHTIKKNIQSIETSNTKYLDEYNESGEKAYSLLFSVVGFNIDRTGI